MWLTRHLNVQAAWETARGACEGVRVRRPCRRDLWSQQKHGLPLGRVFIHFSLTLRPQSGPFSRLKHSIHMYVCLSVCRGRRGRVEAAKYVFLWLSGRLGRQNFMYHKSSQDHLNK